MKPTKDDLERDLSISNEFSGVLMKEVKDLRRSLKGIGDYCGDVLKSCQGPCGQAMSVLAAREAKKRVAQAIAARVAEALLVQ